MERKAKHIDEGTLHAWLDGALGPEESARIEAHVASCAACGAAAAEARGLVAAASRILTALDDVPGGVAPGGRGAGRYSASAGRPRRLWTGWPIRAAAGLLFVVAGSLAVIQQMGTEHRNNAAPSAAQAQPQPQPLPDSISTPAAPLASRKQPLRTPPAKKQRAAAATREVAPRAASGLAGGVAQSAPRTDTVPSVVTITGRVVSAKTGEPVSQAVVHLSNPSVTSATDSTGGYAMQVPSGQATNQPAHITVRRIGFESKVDSVTLAQTAQRDTVRHDIALAPSTLTLDQVVVTGAAATTLQTPAARKRLPTGCYTLDAPGLPARIELERSRVRILPPDSAAFPTADWVIESDSLHIIIKDTSGTWRSITAQMSDAGLRGHVTRSDSTGSTPFVATRTPCP